MSSKIEGNALFLGVRLIPLLCCYTIKAFSIFFFFLKSFGCSAISAAGKVMLVSEDNS